MYTLPPTQRPTATQIRYRAERSSQSSSGEKLERLEKMISQLKWENDILKSQNQALKEAQADRENEFAEQLEKAAQRLRECNDEWAKKMEDKKDLQRRLDAMVHAKMRTTNELHKKCLELERILSTVNAGGKFNREGRPEAIRQIVADYFGVEVEMIATRQRRKPEFVKVKQATMFMLDRFTGLTKAAIAEFCGYEGKSAHCAAIHAIKTIKEDIEKFEASRNIVDKITNSITEKLGSANAPGEQNDLNNQQC